MNATCPKTTPPRTARRATVACALLALLFTTAAHLPLPVLAQRGNQGGYSIAPEAPPIDFRLLHAQADINKKDYTLAENAAPVVFPLGENFYRLELTLKRNSRKSWRGDERVTLHFHYDGTALTFFGDRNGNARPDRREARREHLIRHKHELITEGNLSFMRSVDLHIDLGRAEVTAPASLRHLKLHFIFL